MAMRSWPSGSTGTRRLLSANTGMNWRQARKEGRRLILPPHIMQRFVRKRKSLGRKETKLLQAEGGRKLWFRLQVGASRAGVQTSFIGPRMGNFGAGISVAPTRTVRQ